jgi:hypothetical protein
MAREGTRLVDRILATGWPVATNAGQPQGSSTSLQIDVGLAARSCSKSRSPIS